MTCTANRNKLTTTLQWYIAKSSSGFLGILSASVSLVIMKEVNEADRSKRVYPTIFMYVVYLTAKLCMVELNMCISSSLRYAI